MLLLAGLAIYNGVEVNSAKLIVILLLYMANPTAAHILANTAYFRVTAVVRLRKVTDRGTVKKVGRPEIKPETREKKHE